MAGDSFAVQTFDGNSEPTGWQFPRSMLAGEPAQMLTPTRKVQGTTVRINVRDSDTYELLTSSFPNWCRDVEGLTAVEPPNNRQLPPCDTFRPVAISEIAKLEWVERANLAPVSEPSGWDSRSGSSTISVLYRGVFFQEFTARGLWGIQGSIDVDPKALQAPPQPRGLCSGTISRRSQCTISNGSSGNSHRYG